MWFALLGPLQVRLDDQQLPVRAARQRVLLAALLLTPAQPVSSARLSELVWDGQPPDGAAVTLRSYVKRLRQALGPAAGTRIVTSDHGYLIEASADEVDITRYAALCATAETAMRTRHWEMATELLTQAQALWRGSPLIDVPCQELQVTEVPRLEQLRLQATQWRMEAELQLGNYGKVIPELHALTARHPLWEPFHHQLMVALYSCGRRADALAAYRQARTILINEIGIEPGAELRLLHERLLADDRDLAGTPIRPSPVTAGQAGLPPRQLPPPVPHFAGRGAELDDLTGMLDDRHRRPDSAMIAVISGEAGVGKTTLAVHWSHQAAAAFPDGQLYLDLNGFGPADWPLAQGDAVRRALEALAVPVSRIPVSLEGRVGLYRTLLSERRTLILLDNAKDAAQVRPLLPSGAGCLVLVTSRSPLTGLVAREGARSIKLSVLPEDEARQMVTLRLGPGQSTADQAAVDELINICARLPLALAIAAASVATRPGQSLAAVTSHLRAHHDRLDALSTGEAPTNLRSVLHWSYKALTGDAAEMFRLLAEHPGPDISTAAAASLAGLPVSRASSALFELADLHLISEHASGRFAFHDLLRLYADERLAASHGPAERHAAGLRMLDHYLHTARHAAQLINPIRDMLDLAAPVDQVRPEEFASPEQAAAWFEAEHQVLIRAIGYAAGAEADVHAWQLPWALSDYLNRGGHWSDFAATQQVALAATGRLGDLPAQAYAHRYIGRAYFQLQDFDLALDHLTSALRLRRRLSEPAGEAGTSLDLCRVHEQRGEFGQALRFARRALRLYKSAGHRIGEAHALNSVGWYHALRQQYPAALGICREALALSEELGYSIGVGHTSHSLGYICQHLGDATDAIACYERALGIFRQLGERHHEAMTLADLGDACHGCGDLPAARRAWRQALAILDDLNHADGDQVRARITVS